MRLAREFYTRTDVLEVARGDAKPPSGSSTGRISLRALPYLHRSVRADDMVHFVPDLARYDFSDQRSCNRGEAKRGESVKRPTVVF